MPLLCSKSSPLGHVAYFLARYLKRHPSIWLAFDYEFNDGLLTTKWYKFLSLSIPCKSYTMISDHLYYLIIESVSLLPTNKPLGTFSACQHVRRKNSLIRLLEMIQKQAVYLSLLSLWMLGFLGNSVLIGHPCIESDHFTCPPDKISPESKKLGDCTVSCHVIDNKTLVLQRLCLKGMM